MEKENRIIKSEILSEDTEIELSLRPRYLNEFIGQEKIKESLFISIKAAVQRQEALDHILLHGPPGLGKTTLAYVIANELNVNIKTTSGPAIEIPGDLASILTNLSDRDVLFIDEIHRLNRLVEEALYPAMEDFKFDMIIGKGPSAKSIRLEIPRFTLIGATTRAGLITSPLRNRFGINHRIDYYCIDEAKQIIERSSKILKLEIDQDGILEIAKRSRGTPRVANRLLKRVRDYAQVKYDGKITQQIAEESLNLLEIDKYGLDNMDRKILSTIIEKYSGGPVGIETIAISVGEEKDTIEDVYEPFLILQGFLHRTRQGRIATELAYKHLGKTPPPKFQTLFNE